MSRREAGSAVAAPRPMTRRQFLAVTAHACAACAAPIAPASTGRLRVTPRKPVTSVAPGEHALGLDSARDGLLFVPAGYRPETPAPLVVMLHGAGGAGARVRFTFPIADDLGVVVLAPDSRARNTWDAIRGHFGPDIAFLERALHHTFERCAIAADRLAIGGFSDGASYALSVGLASGDVFRHICAFSPGFIVPVDPIGRPAVFISHGTRDTVLPIDQTSRRLVPQLRAGGYSITYKEFDGGHSAPPAMVREALGALAVPPSARIP